MNKFVILFLLIWFLSIVGCSNKPVTLNNLYKRIADNLRGSEYLNEVRSTHDDSLFQLTGAYDRKYEGKILLDSIDSNIWFEANRERFLRLDKLVKDDILIRSFKRYIDGRKIFLDEIKKEAMRAADIRELEWSKKQVRWINELKSLIDLNDKNCNVGDTIKLLFQLRGDENYYDVVYKQYPSSTKFYLSDDTLKVLGVLKSKIYDKERSGNPDLDSSDIMNLWFCVKIIDISNKVSHNGPYLLRLGDDFKFELAFYGLKIK